MLSKTPSTTNFPTQTPPISAISTKGWRAIAILADLIGFALIMLGATGALSENSSACYSSIGVGSALIVLGTALAAAKGRKALPKPATTPLSSRNSTSQPDASLAAHIRTTLDQNGATPKRRVLNYREILCLAERGVPSANLIIPSIYLGNRPVLVRICHMAIGQEANRKEAESRHLPGLEIDDALPHFTRIISINTDATRRDLFNVPSGVERIKIGAIDDVNGWNSLRANFNPAFAKMDAARAANSPLLLHCQCGVSRSATLMAAYLIYKAHVTTDEAVNFLRIKRNIIDPKPPFILGLHAYARELGVEPPLTA